MSNTSTNSGSITITQALGQLPLEQPERSAWPALAAQLQRPQKRRLPWPRVVLLAAMAAAAVIVPWQMLPTSKPSGTELASTTEQSAVVALMAESAQLEHLLSAMTDNDMASASATLLGLQLEDQLSEIDARLSAEPSDSARQTALWQQRVALLRDYAALASAQRWMASEGEPLDADLVAVF